MSAKKIREKCLSSLFPGPSTKFPSTFAPQLPPPEARNHDSHEYHTTQAISELDSSENHENSPSSTRLQRKNITRKPVSTVRAGEQDESPSTTPNDGSYSDELKRAINNIGNKLRWLDGKYKYLDLRLLEEASPTQIAEAHERFGEWFLKMAKSHEDTNIKWNSCTKRLSKSENEVAQLSRDLKKLRTQHKKDNEENAKEKQHIVYERSKVESGLREKLKKQTEASSKAEKDFQRRLSEGVSKAEKRVKDDCELIKKQAVNDLDRKMKDRQKIAITEWKEQVEILKKQVDTQKTEAERVKGLAEENSRNLLLNQQIEDIKHQEQQAEKFNATFQAMVSSYEAQKSVMEAQIEELRSGLVEQVKRGHFGSMDDCALSARFQGIVISVEEFSRYPWDISHVTTWPYPQRAFPRSENTRRTKQFILQNNLWLVLYNKIFRTPFQLLGQIGKERESQWIDLFQDRASTGNTCPSATKDSEKWRYEAIKKYTEVIHQKSENETRLVYQQTLKETCNIMCQELENITEVTSDDRRLITTLVANAAKLWLEVGQQQYRISVLMSESGREPARCGLPSQNTTPNIVETPGLRRFGNSEGDRLETEEVVMGCEGKFASVHLLL